MRTYRRFFYGIAIALIVTAGCEQPEDIVTPVSETELRFVSKPNQPQGIERLPSLPAGMIYELWVSRVQVFDTTVATNNLLSIARFHSFNSDTGHFILDANNRKIESFTLPDDLYKYKSIFVSVERVADNNPNRPANIMLMDNIRGFNDQVITLNFPLSDELWLAIVRFNMEGITDNLASANDGAGVWFANYRRVNHNIPDTTDIRHPSDPTKKIDTSLKEEIVPALGPNPGDTTNMDSLTRCYPYWFTNIRPETTYLDLGPESLLVGSGPFRHIYMAWDTLCRRDTTYPYMRTKINFTYITTPRPVSVDIFTQDAFGLPDYSRWGWKWEGWAVSPTVAQSAHGRITRPAWIDSTANTVWLPGASGGLLSTGTFSRIDRADDEDLFWLPAIRHIDTIRNTGGQIVDIDTLYKKPEFPGEDFLNTDSLQKYLGLTSVQLMPNATGNIGTVFITLEPLNRLTDSTNFPLIAFTATLPANRTAIADTNVSIPMFNKTSTPTGVDVGTGFPEIRMTFRRF